MNRFIYTLCMALVFTICHAQNSKKNQDEFDAFRAELYNDFEDFREEIISDYIEFVRNPWKEFESVSPIPRPSLDPTPPIVIPDSSKDTTRINSTPIIIDDVIKPIPVTPQPQPIGIIPDRVNNNDCKIEIIFYGTPFEIRFYKNNSFHIGILSEESVANALRILSNEVYDNSILDCVNIKEKYRLCDWAYLQFVQQFSYEACGKDSNESTLFSAYILLQSGYKIRLAYSGERLYLLYASNHCMFDRSSYIVDGDYYYSIGELPARLHISGASFPKEQGISLIIDNIPLFAQDLSEKRVITSGASPMFKIESQVNKNLLAFYDTYPCSYYDDNYMTQWSLYANTPMDPFVVKTFYPTIREMLKELPEKEQVSMLLNLVQMGFEYDFDDKVWGHDRTFFAEETLYYPYSDCEDRSVLLSRLVRDLVGLECILVYYPGHLATAICFNSAVDGDYIDLDGRRYTICDPTYIGAPIGMSMPKINKEKVGAILLY